MSSKAPSRHGLGAQKARMQDSVGGRLFNNLNSELQNSQVSNVLLQMGILIHS